MSDNAEQAVVEQAVNNEVTTAEAVEQPQFTELESWDDGDDIEITPTTQEISNEENQGSLQEDQDSDSGSDREKSSEEDRSTESKARSTEEKDQSGEEASDQKDQVALKDDSLVEVKIDGKVEEISLKDLKSNYSGKVAYDKKFSELDRERQAYKKEVEEVNTYVNTFAKKMKDGDALSAMEYLGSFAGVGPHEIKAQLIKSLLPEIDRLNDMTPAEVDLEYKQAELDYVKQKQESDLQNFKQQQSNMELESKIVKVQETLNINNSEWNEAVQFLDQTLPPQDQITPELVGEYVQFVRSETRAKNLLESFDSSLIQDEEVFAGFQDIISRNPDFTDEDLNAILKNAFSDSQKQVVEENLKETVEKKSKKKEQPRNEKGQFTPNRS